jgi:hypothetical protein
MKKLAFLILSLLIVVAIFWFFRQSTGKMPASVESTTIELSTHSPQFSEMVSRTMAAYLAMKDAFVDFDTAAVKKNALIFISDLDSIPLDEMKSDSGNVFDAAVLVRNNIRMNILSLVGKTNITDMRKDFSAASDLIYPEFLQLIHYHGPRLYLQHCPMAFNDTMGANWISNSHKIMNPYLGRFDPKYKSGMLHCGEVLDSTAVK